MTVPEVWPTFRREQLQVGDVLLSRGYGALAEAISHEDGSDFSHAAFYSGDGAVIEAVATGVTERPLLESMAGNDPRAYTYVFRWKRAAEEPAQLDAIVAAARVHLGKGFDFAGMVRSAALKSIARRHRPSERRSKRVATFDSLPAEDPSAVLQTVYCSALVALAFMEGGDPAGSCCLTIRVTDDLRLQPERFACARPGDAVRIDTPERCCIVTPQELAGSSDLDGIGRLDLSFAGRDDQRWPEDTRQKATLLFVGGPRPPSGGMFYGPAHMVIEDAVRSSRYGSRIDVRKAPGSPGDLVRELQGRAPHIVHLDADATTDATAHDHRLRTLHHALGGHGRKPQLLVMTTSHTAWVTELQDVAKCVIGMEGEVTEAASRTFERTFYTCLAEGATVLGAFESARDEAKLTHVATLAPEEDARHLAFVDQVHETSRMALEATPPSALEVALGMGEAFLKGKSAPRQRAMGRRSLQATAAIAIAIVAYVGLVASDEVPVSRTPAREPGAPERLAILAGGDAGVTPPVANVAPVSADAAVVVPAAGDVPVAPEASEPPVPKPRQRVHAPKPPRVDEARRGRPARARWNPAREADADERAASEAPRPLPRVDCRARGACAESGRCSLIGGSCRATAADCAKGTPICDVRGLCLPVDGVCEATDATCRRSAECRTDGRCSARAGRCWLTRDSDCKHLCHAAGLCRLAGGACVASSDRECERSNACSTRGLCRKEGDRCAR